MQPQEPTQAATVQSEEDTGPQHAPATPSEGQPGEEGQAQPQEPTQAATVQKEEDAGPPNAPATPSARKPGRELGRKNKKRRASEHRFNVVEKDPGPRRRFGAFFKKAKESDDEDVERLETPSHIQSQDTFWHRCLRRAGLRNDRSIRAPMAEIGASVVADGPLATVVWDERIAIFDLDRQNASNNGTCRRPDVQCPCRG